MERAAIGTSRLAHGDDPYNALMRLLRFSNRISMRGGTDIGCGSLRAAATRVTPMTALLPEYLKLIMLLLLVGSIIGLSHLPGETRNGSALANAEGASGRMHTHWVHVRKVRAAAADRRTSFVPNYCIDPRQHRFKALLG